YLYSKTPATPDTYTLSLHDALPILKNRNKPAGVKDFKVTPVVLEFLARNNYDLQTILPAGKTIDLLEKIGVNYGGSSAEVTHITDRKSTRLNSSHRTISYAVFCLKK